MSVVPPNFENSSLSPGSSRNHLQSGQNNSKGNAKRSLPSSSARSKAGTFDFPDEDNRDVNDPNQEWDVLNKYLQDKELLQVINSWMLLIASLEELPYNPYPTLVWYARRQAERFHLFFEDEDTILQKLDYSTYNIGERVAKTQEEPPQWGLLPLLKAVNSKTLDKFDWLLTTIPLDASHQDTFDANYVVHQPVPVLTGPCIFLGSFYPDVPLVTVKLEYGIAGPRKDHAVEIFVELVLNGIKGFEEQDAHRHILLGVLVPEQDDQGWSYSTWTFLNLCENREEFLFMVQAATRNQKNIILQCLFRLDPNSQYYKRGEMTYSLNFMRVESDRVISESPVPYLSAYQGVFNSHSSFVSYLAWFDNVERPEKPPEFREPTTITNKRSSIFFTRAKKTSTRKPLSSIASTTATSRTALGGAGTIGSSVYPEGGPYAEHVRDTIRKHIQQNIASFPGYENLFVVLHRVILLLLFDRDQGQAEDGLVEAYRLLQSTLYKMYLIIEENSFLQSLVSRFAKQECADSYVVQMLYLEYRQHLKDLLCNDLHERSSEFTVAGQVLLDKLDAITVRPTLRGSSSDEPGTLPLDTQVFHELQVINRYCTTLMLGLVDDALVFCPTLKQYLPPIDTSAHSLLTSYPFKHGVEQQSLLHQDKTYLNVHDAQEKIRAPTLISSQAVILKYFVETRLDQTFEEFLGQLLSSSCLPPNPYPRLVSHFRVAAVSMEMFGETRERLVSRLLPGSAQLVDAKHFLYGFPGSEAYGMISSLFALDSKHYKELLTKTSVVHNEILARVTDQGIKATVGVAVTGFSPLYGRLMPYFHEVELEEHYLLQGPSHIRTEVINYFTKLVYDHLAGFAEESSVLLVGLFLGDVRRSLSDIVQKKSSFIAQLSSTVKQRKRVYMKAYIKMDWRLVLVKKSFLLHYIEGQFIGYQRFYTQSPITFYQNVFSSQATASLFARACGPQDSSNPCKGANLKMSLVHVDHHIESAKQDGDLLSTYRWLLFRALMCQTSSYVAEAWYMLHSAAAQLEYLITLNKTLQNLIYEELSRTFAPAREDAGNNPSLLDVSVLGRMTMAYSQKLHEVLKRGTCMAPSALKDLLQNKLRSVTYVNQESNTLQLMISQKSISVLQEMNDYLQPLLDASANEIHQICPDVQHALRSLTMEIQLS